jgi:putative transposase
MDGYHPSIVHASFAQALIDKITHVPTPEQQRVERDLCAKQSLFSEEQIIVILRNPRPRRNVTKLCRRRGISDATFYTWRNKYGGLEISEMRRLRQLDEETSG